MTAPSARRHLLGLTFSVTAFAMIAPVFGQDLRASQGVSERIALAYVAPQECPTDAAFRALVRDRVTFDWEAGPGELARRISVSVVLRGERYLAAIEFLGPQSERVTRSVAGKSCGDVVNGIALVTALAIQSRVEEALERSEPESPPAVAPKPESPKPAAAPAPARTPRARRGVPSRTHLRVGGAAAVTTGVGPVATLGPAFFAAVEWDGPRFGVAGDAFWSGSVRANGVPVRFRRLAARVEGCPLSVPVARVSFEPCAFLELGSLRGDGELAPPAVVKEGGGASLWVAPGAAGRVVVSLEPLVVSLEATARIPVLREQFGVAGSGNAETLQVYQVPPVVLGGALGLGIRL